MPCFRLLATIGLLGSVLSGDPLPLDAPIRGWTLLSDNEALAQKAISRAANYQINHLQLSHRIIHDLREVDEPATRDLVNRLVDSAHQAGIEEVVVWDHALYPLDYYPERFRTGPGGLIDLDTPEFWEWLKADYRRMLDLVPEIDGIILTFIETGAHAEDQYSVAMPTEAERLAAVVNAIADVVVGERQLALYARSFSYTREEFANVLDAFALIERPEVKVMMKETPHDFFLYHPANDFIGSINRPTLIEFDAAGEYFGQAVITSAIPELILERWREVGPRPNVVGYVARTDRYGETQIVGRAAEINLHALHRAFADPQVTAEQVYDEFIAQRYGPEAWPDVKAALRRSFDIASASLYTLGTDKGNRHSRLNYDTHTSSYVRHVSGKWIDPPIVFVRNGVNREFHFWRDVVDHLAPAYIKDMNNPIWDEVPEVKSSGWIRPGDELTEEYLRLVLIEKAHGLEQAQAGRADIERARPMLAAEDYAELSQLFDRTVLTARLHHAVAAAYLGFRLWCRGPEHRTEFVISTTQGGLEQIELLVPLVTNYAGPVPTGQWDWRADADRAMRYFRQITEDGWPAETNGAPNPEGGMIFPYKRP